MGEKLTDELIEHLREAQAIATKVGDQAALYFVDRALGACLTRWGPKPVPKEQREDSSI
jgi:hypothetical protein